MKAVTIARHASGGGPLLMDNGQLHTLLLRSSVGM